MNNATNDMSLADARNMYRSSLNLARSEFGFTAESFKAETSALANHNMGRGNSTHEAWAWAANEVVSELRERRDA